MRERLLAAWAQSAAVDHHCHPLRRPQRRITATELRSVFTESVEPRQIADHIAHTAVYRDALRRLATELGCEPTEEAVLEARAARDPAVHLLALLRAGGTGAMLLDHGYALAGAMDADEHRRTVPLPQREAVRLETLAETLVPRCRSVGEWLEAVRVELRRAVEERGAVAVKTIAAYRAGLWLRAPDRADVAAAYAELRELAERGGGVPPGIASMPGGGRGVVDPPPNVRVQGDPLCHALLLDAAEEVRRLEVPMQVHCGLGDADSDLADASPLGLRPLLGGGRFSGLRLVLLHCYPYHREAAYLCALHADVYMDLSLALPQAGCDGTRAMGEALGLCPWTKLLYATDATALPEAYFVAAVRHREALASALAELVEGSVLDETEAVAAGLRVLAGNAAALYGLEQWAPH